MQDFVFFLGRFHVLALHLPIGIVIAAVVLDWLARRPRHSALAEVSPFLWGGAAISAVVTALLGYLHFAEGAFTGPSADAHRLWGTVTALGALASWWLARRAGRAGPLRLTAGVAMLGLVSATGHYGGILTHGATFLGEYARLPAPSVPGADPQLVADLAAAGLLARQVSQSDARLVVSPSSPGSPVPQSALEALAAAAGVIVDLNLAAAALDDADLEAIGSLPAATHLRLARNELTDAALAVLARSPRLEYLTLYGNPGITDAGVEALAAAANLREVYLWRTGVTPAGAERLRTLRPDLSVSLGLTNRDLP